MNKKIMQLVQSLENSLEYVPKMTFWLFWVGSFIYPLNKSLALYVQIPPFFVMTVIVMNYYTKTLSLKIYDYANLSENKKVKIKK